MSCTLTRVAKETTMSDNTSSAAAARASSQVPAKKKFPTSFGVFSPTGYVLMVFSDDAKAEEARRALLEHGFKEPEVTHYDRQEVLNDIEKNEKHAEEPLQIG